MLQFTSFKVVGDFFVNLPLLPIFQNLKFLLFFQQLHHFLENLRKLKGKAKKEEGQDWVVMREPRNEWSVFLFIIVAISSG